MPGRSFRTVWMISVLFALAAGFAHPSFARAKTDVLVMQNGDRFTCEVKSLSAGVLQVDLDYVDGTLSIDWRKVARLESKALFLVQLQDGTIYAGKVVTPETLPGTPVKLEIQPDTEESLVVNRSSIVRMTQFSDSFWRRFSWRITSGSTYAKGNNSTQYNLGSQLDYQQARWGASLGYDSNLSSNSGARTSTRNQVEWKAYRLLPWTNYFYAGTASLLQSSVQQVQYQTVLGAGVGRILKNTDRTRASVLGGLGWLRTKYEPSVEAGPTQDIAVGVVVANLDAFRFKRTRLDISASAFPAITQDGRLFSRVNASYYIKLFSKIDWNLSFYGNWDTQPPAHLPGSDYGSSTGLSWTFGNVFGNK